MDKEPMSVRTWHFLATFRLLAYLTLLTAPSPVRAANFSRFQHLVPQGPIAIAAFRLGDGDDYVDLAAASALSDSIAILRGAGLGAFLAPILLPTPDGPVDITVADFNTDGKPDLAIACEVADQIAIYLANTGGIP